MTTFENNCSEILALFKACGKDLPTADSDEGRSVQILQTICDSQSHTIPDIETLDGWEGEANPEDIQNENIANFSEFFDAIEEITSKIGEDDFTLEFDGNEYRIISESTIWDIYVETIKEIVDDCYDLKLDKVPSFIALTIDWEQTAQNAYADGYGHTFSGYDGSEEEAAGYYIFRTN